MWGCDNDHGGLPWGMRGVAVLHARLSEATTAHGADAAQDVGAATPRGAAMLRGAAGHPQQLTGTLPGHLPAPLPGAPRAQPSRARPRVPRRGGRNRRRRCGASARPGPAPPGSAGPFRGGGAAAWAALRSVAPRGRPARPPAGECARGVGRWSGGFRGAGALPVPDPRGCSSGGVPGAPPRRAEGGGDGGREGAGSLSRQRVPMSPCPRRLLASPVTRCHAPRGARRHRQPPPPRQHRGERSTGEQGTAVGCGDNGGVRGTEE